MHTRETIDPKVKILLWVAVGAIVLGLVLPPILSGDSPLPLLLPLLAFAVAFAIPVTLGRKRLSLMGAWLAAYVISYAILSSRGAYINANLGGNDNRSIWYAAHCGEAYRSRSGRQKSELRPLGWFFLPLVLADQWFVHRTDYDAF